MRRRHRPRRPFLQRGCAIPLNVFIASLSRPGAPVRMRGTAFYLTTQAETVPAALALNVKHNGVVHDQVILLKVVTDPRRGYQRKIEYRSRDCPPDFSVLNCTSGLQRNPMFPRRLPCTRKRLAVIRPIARSSWVGKRLFHR